MTVRALLLLAVVAAGCAAAAGPGLRTPSVPFVATPDDVGGEMLRLGDVTAGDTVYDLGAGDGRLVIAAARLGAHGVGVEIDPQLVQDSREAAARAGVADRAAFVWGDLFETDLRPATVVLMYLLPEINLRLRPKLLAELRPGARIVSHRFDMDDWPPDGERGMRLADGAHTIFLWIVPARVEGRWTLRLAAPGGGEEITTLSLTQRFQRLSGTLRRGAAQITLTEGRLRGEEIGFTAAGSETIRFAGRVTGDRAAGTASVLGGAAPAERAWTARRESL